MQERDHVQMSQEMIHHSNTPRNRSGAATQFDTMSMSELVRGVCGIERKQRPQSPGSGTTNGR